MLPAQRRGRIIEILRANRAASFRDLAEALNASISTVRRDVDYLDENGYLDRTHGGAVLRTGNRTAFEPAAEIAAALAPDAKRAIGVRAAALVRPGQTVIFDSGTTTLAAARALKEAGTTFTAVTNDLTIAGALSADRSVEVIVVGGAVRAGSPTLLGAATRRFIGGLNVDIAFIGAHAVSDGFLSDTSIDLAEVKRAMIDAAESAVLLADSAKFGDPAFARFAAISEIDRVISDADLDPDVAADIRARGPILDQVDPVRAHAAATEPAGAEASV